MIDGSRVTQHSGQCTFTYPFLATIISAVHVVVARALSKARVAFDDPKGIREDVTLPTLPVPMASRGGPGYVGWNSGRLADQDLHLQRCLKLKSRRFEADSQRTGP